MIHLEIEVQYSGFEPYGLAYLIFLYQASKEGGVQTLEAVPFPIINQFVCIAVIFILISR